MPEEQGILGIDNRTENWKTAQAFAPFFENPNARLALANRLLKPLGEELKGDGNEEVKLEQFWKGMRDYVRERKKRNEEPLTAECCGHLYEKLFPDLRLSIQGYQKHNPCGLSLAEHSYDVSTEKRKKKLYSNLYSTEIDIVLDTSSYLFIGEAKDESDIDAKLQYILVHQLIRQYVTARILVSLSENYSHKTVIPFIVGTKVEGLKNKHQVDFMALDAQGWLRKGNILCWKDIDKLGQSAS